MTDQAGDPMKNARGVLNRRNLPGTSQALQEWMLGKQDKRLVILIVPADGEKSGCIRQIISQNHTLVIWVILDESDNQPEVFTQHLEGAIKVLTGGKLGNHFEPSFDPEDWMTAFINGCLDLPGEVRLVLDGYHQIKASEVHELVTMLVDYLPPQMHVILISQDEPPLPLARWRVRRQMAELIT